MNFERIMHQTFHELTVWCENVSTTDKFDDYVQPFHIATNDSGRSPHNHTPSHPSQPLVAPPWAGCRIFGPIYSIQAGSTPHPNSNSPHPNPPLSNTTISPIPSHPRSMESVRTPGHRCAIGGVGAAREVAGGCGRADRGSCQAGVPSRRPGPSRTRRWE